MCAKESPLSTLKERRTDTDLRQAIDRIKASAKPGADIIKTYDQILTETLRLSGADYGIIATVPPPNHTLCLTPKAAFRRDEKHNACVPVTLPAPMTPSAPFAKMIRHACPLIRHDQKSLTEILPLFEGIQFTEFKFEGRRLKGINHDYSHRSLTQTYTGQPATSVLQKQAAAFCSVGIFPFREEHTVQLVVVILAQQQPLEPRLLTRLGALFLHGSCALRTLDVAVPGSISARFLANRQLVNLIRNSITGVITVNQTLQITLVNPSAEQQFGILARDLLGKPLSEIFPEVNSDLLERHKVTDVHRPQLSTWHRQERLQLQGKRSNQSLFPTELVVFDTLAKGARFTTLLIEDISEKSHLHNQYEESLSRLRILSDLAPVGIIQVDEKWHCTYANDHWMELSGLNRQETLSYNWINAISTADVESVMNDLSHCLLNQQDFLRQLCLISPLGKRRWVQMTARGLVDQSGQNHNGFLATFADISEQRQAQERLKELAQSDTLTGLVNRPFLTERVQKALEQETIQHQIALIYIDLDGFKQVNDSYGHLAGDELLKKFALRLRQIVRDTDTVARLGGDEFAVLLEHVPDVKIVENIAENLLCALSSPIQIGKNIEVYVGASIGISLTKPGTINAERLLKQADLAMYRAKTNGKNTTCIYTPELGSVISQRMDLRNQLHRAVERNELAVYFQPQIDLASNMIWGFEALLRWQHPSKGFISPSEFVPILEETGLVRSVGMWVIHQACSALKSWQKLGLVSKSTSVSVNVSAVQLHDTIFVEGVEQALQKYDIHPESLVIEITETALVQGTLSKQILNALRELGVKISLDDFGTGYSSLSYITCLPLDHLKIDRSFIARIPTDQHSAHITKAIISMAKGMGLTVVAEGVDSQERLAMLKNTNCDIYQGFHFSEAITHDQIQKQLITSDDNPKQATKWSCLTSA